MINRQIIAIQKMIPGKKHFLFIQGPINNIHEAPVIGNGDLGALVQIFHNEFRLHLAKNNIWDARFDNIAEKGIVTQDNLIKMSRDYGFHLEGAAYNGTPVYDRLPPNHLRYIDHYKGWDLYPFPCPKPAGCIRILHSGYSSTKIQTTVDISKGFVISEFKLDFGWHGIAILEIHAFVDRNSNAIRIRIVQKKNFSSFRLCVEKQPDSIDPSIPLPKVKKIDSWNGIVSQTIPAGYGAKKFTWYLAASFPKPTKDILATPIEVHPYRLWQKCELKKNSKLEFMIGVATDRDSLPPTLPTKRQNNKLVAIKKTMFFAGDSTPAEYEKALKSHERSWQEFWGKSGIELEDKELEKSWYRNLFALACHIRKGTMSPGLVGNIAVWDSSPWHGTFTVNMNIQKMFLASIPTNHAEWIDCYTDWLYHMLPSFRYLAKEIFNLKGIYSPHMVFPFLQPQRQATSNQCGRALGMTGWHGQPLWWRWEYLRDKNFLTKKAYPYFKEAACFYWRYLQKHLDESGDLYPSLNLEGPPWTKNFEHNRDCIIDLILFHNTFKYALEASRILNTDKTWRKKWGWALSMIRPVKTGRLPDGHWWIYADKNDFPPKDTSWRNNENTRYSQAVFSAWTVFPGEYVNGDENEGLAPCLRDIMKHTQWHTMNMMTWIHHWWCAIPALRMQLPEAFDIARKIILRERFPAGHAKTTHWIHLQPDAWRAPEDNYLGVVATTEMLLQSQGGIIRLFPCWPKSKKASFYGFPARGGFIISASFDPQKGISAEIKSIAGEKCRVKLPHGTNAVVNCAKHKTKVLLENQMLVFNTLRDKVYKIILEQQ